MRFYYGFAAALLSCNLFAAPPEPQVATPEQAAAHLTLDAAISRAFAVSPRISSAQADVRSAEGQAQQAGLLPNPELGLEAENIAGTGLYRAIDGAVYTLSLTQEVELGGKRGLRRQAARELIEQQRSQLANERLELIQQVTIAYIKLIATQEQLSLARERSRLAEALLQEVKARVQAAREPQIQLSQAEIALATAHLAQEILERELKHTQHVLANFWLGRRERFRYDNTPFFNLAEPVDEAALQAALRQHPGLKYWASERKRRESLLKLERAEALPDPSVQLGVRQFEETGDTALVLGVSVALPVFNRNQGSIAQARAQSAKSESRQTSAWVELTNQALQSLEDMINAYRQAQTLAHAIIPAAERAFKLAHEGYSSGRFPYLEVIEAQRTLFETKESYIGALSRYHEAKAQVEYAMATHHGKPVQ